MRERSHSLSASCCAWRIALALAMALAMSCTPADDAATGGARAATSPDGWTLGAEPVVRLGDAVWGDGAFERVTSAMRQRSGRLVVADGGALELRIFSADGTHLRTVGGRGHGPGEFRSLTWAGLLAGDSIVAYDFRSGALDVLGPDGDFVRRVRLQREQLLDGSPAPLWPTPLLVVGDSVLLAARWMPQPQPGEGSVRVDSTTLHLASVHDGGTRPVVTVPVRRSYGSRGYSMVMPFSPELSVAPAGGDALHVGYGDAPVVRVVGLDGARRDSIALPVRARRVDDGEIAAFERRYLDEANPFLSPSARRGALARLDYPPAHPAYRRLLADERERLWVAADSTRWLVLDSAGVTLASLTFPGGVEPLQIGADWLLARSTDEDGVQEVRVYALRR